MKILIATGIYPPDVGGPATYSKLLFDELPKHNIKVKVLSFGEVRWVPRLVRHFVYFLKALWYARSVDVIYAQDPGSVGGPSMVASKIMHKKFIIKIVGDYEWEQLQLKSNYFLSPEDFRVKKFGSVIEIRKKIGNMIAKNADKIIVPSEYLKKIVMAWGVKEEKISVIYNSFEYNNIDKAKKEDVRTRLGISGTLIMSAGRIVPWKGFVGLIKIMPNIIKKIPDAKLCIAGDGPQYKELELEIENLGLKENVKLLGRLQPGMLGDYIRASDVFVLNTGYEGLSHQLLEVISIGTPIITTNVGGNPEVIENGEEGVLVDYEDTNALESEIVALLNDKKRANYLVENARKKLSLFSKERMIKETVRVLSE